MNQTTAKILGDGALGGAVVTGAAKSMGLLEFLNNYSGALGLMLSAFFGICGLILHRISQKKQDLASKNEKKLIEMDETHRGMAEEIKKLKAEKNDS